MVVFPFDRYSSIQRLRKKRLRGCVGVGSMLMKVLAACKDNVTIITLMGQTNKRKKTVKSKQNKRNRNKTSKTAEIRPPKPLKAE